ncbi:MAG: hypothetical protein ACI38U_14390 [Corynebacterium sp.]|uniref:hypothetical protein n=1 Tax=Corynebacterium sp. TaxID=1720 RepID=UPI003F080CE6
MGIIATAIYQLRGKSAEQGPEWYRTLSEDVRTLRAENKEIRSDLSKMSQKVDTMERELTGLQRWKDAALSFMRQLLALVSPDQHPVIPLELREDLDEENLR